MFSDKNQNRREFFRDLARGGALLGLAMFGGAMAWHRMNADPEIVSCVNEHDCRTCGVFKRCNLPPRQEFFAREKHARREATHV